MSEKLAYVKAFLNKELGNYTAVLDNDDGDSQTSTANFEPRSRQQQWSSVCSVLPWTLVFIFASVSALLLAVICSERGSPGQTGVESSKWGTFGTGYKTDFADAKNHIDLINTVFHFGPEFSDNGTMYNPDTDVKRYSGDPAIYGEEIERNWAELIDYRYIRITEAEAYEAFGDQYKDYWNERFGAYVAGIEVFHTLHCVYFLWTAFYPEHFFHGRHRIPDAEVVHRDHCIEHIRQYLMCHADLSPTPTKFFAGLGRNYVLSNNPHVCRDFGKLRAWMTDRSKGPHEVMPYQKPA